MSYFKLWLIIETHQAKKSSSKLFLFQFPCEYQPNCIHALLAFDITFGHRFVYSTSSSQPWLEGPDEHTL